MSVRKHISGFDGRRVIRLALFVLFWFVLADVLLWAAPGVFFPPALRRNPVFSSAYTEWCLAHLPKKVDHPRLFFLGDSTGQGIKMETRYILPAQLEAALRKHPGLEDLEVVNVSEVATGPVDKLVLLAAFADYSADLFVLELSHRMFSNHSFTKEATLYPAVAIEAVKRQPDAGIEELVPKSILKRARLKLAFMAKKSWRLYAAGNMCRFWFDSDAGKNFMNRLGGKEPKGHLNWIQRTSTGKQDHGEITWLMKYITDTYTQITEERRQVKYLTKLARFINKKKPPMFMYLVHVDLEFMEFAARLAERDPEKDIKKVHDAHVMIKDVLRREGIEDLTDFLGIVPTTGTIDVDHLMPEGNAIVAEEIAKRIVPMITGKEGR